MLVYADLIDYQITYVILCSRIKSTRKFTLYTLLSKPEAKYDNPMLI